MYFYILGESAVFKSYETCDKFCFGAIYKGCLWEEELGVSVLKRKSLFGIFLN